LGSDQVIRTLPRSLCGDRSWQFKKKETKHCTSNKGNYITKYYIKAKHKKKCSSSGVQQGCITHYITKNIEKITVHRVGIWSNDQNFTKIPFDEFALNHSKHHICTISKVCMVAVLGSNSYHVGFWKLRKHQTSFAQNGIKLSRKKNCTFDKGFASTCENSSPKPFKLILSHKSSWSRKRKMVTRNF